MSLASSSLYNWFFFLSNSINTEITLPEGLRVYFVFISQMVKPMSPLKFLLTTKYGFHNGKIRSLRSWLVDSAGICQGHHLQLLSRFPVTTISDLYWHSCWGMTDPDFRPPNSHSSLILEYNKIINQKPALELCCKGAVPWGIQEFD